MIVKIVGLIRGTRRTLMATIFERLDDKLREFIGRQPVFFVATSPLQGDGHINLSPKGYDAFRILDDQTVAYLDLMGSGIETVAHVKENGRIVIMFCSFDSTPKILRLHGRGEAIEPGHPEFDSLVGLFPKLAGTRSVIKVHVNRIADSCGWGVPLMEFKEHRRTLVEWAENSNAKMPPEKILEIKKKYNGQSIDALPGLNFH
jgi:hypothetical protein